jgi:hypothetical protein
VANRLHPILAKIGYYLAGIYTVTLNYKQAIICYSSVMSFPEQTLDGFLEARRQANAMLAESDNVLGKRMVLDLAEAATLQTSQILMSHGEEIYWASIARLAPVDRLRVQKSLASFSAAGVFNDNRLSGFDFGPGKIRIHQPTDFGKRLISLFTPYEPGGCNVASNFPGQTLNGFAAGRDKITELLDEHSPDRFNGNKLGLDEVLVLQAANALLDERLSIRVSTVEERLPPIRNSVASLMRKFEQKLGIFEFAEPEFGVSAKEYAPTEFGHLALMAFEPNTSKDW